MVLRISNSIFFILLGSYNYTFTAPGTYYYSSGPVDDDATFYMKGIVRVSSANSTTQRLSLRVGGFEAAYDTGGIGKVL